MATVEFHFKQKNAWTMGPACGDVMDESINPAPVTTGCIYIIHNANENTTYVGYADNAQHRWNARTEIFHTFGIPEIYAQNILCAYCVPSVDNGQSMFLEGRNNCEHLLIRAVVNGLLGVTTSTNTALRRNYFMNATATRVVVHLPSDPWGRLEGAKWINVPAQY